MHPTSSAAAYAAVPAAAPTTVATALVQLLTQLGVTHAFGVMGGAIAPFFHAVAHGDLTALHMRHETGAAFAAVEASLATGRPTLVFTTAGPGLTNAITGMLAARWEGARVVFVSAATSAAQRGRIGTQETGPTTVDLATVAHLAVTIEHAAQLAPLAIQLATAFARPGGFVAHVSLPIDQQRAPCPPPPRLGDHRALVPRCDPATLAEHAALLRARPPVVWLGFGARDAVAPIRHLVERLGARVICSPRAKGVFPEDHPQFLGVTGVGGHSRVDEVLAADRPDYTLVLGTRLGESTSFWASEFAPARAFIQVDVDAGALGVAYPQVPTHGVVADVGEYVLGLRAALGPAGDADAATPELPIRRGPRHAPRASGPVRPQYLFEELQRVVVDGSDAWLMAESGNAFCWANHLLRFATPGRYRVSPGFGSMGHAATGVVGAALARRDKAVAVVGDGAMIMQNELHAAVQHRADALWVILNDACYLMCAQGMAVMGWEPFSCELPRIDFVAMARAVGADGERVATELELGPALERALVARGPWVLDVTIDPREQPPSGRRNRSLMQQGHAAPKAGS